MNLRPWSRDVSSQTHHLLIDQEVRELTWAAEQPYLLIARSACVCEVLDLSAVPDSARAGFLEMQVKRLSPWARPAYYVAAGESAEHARRTPVWIWDAAWEERLRETLPERIRQSSAFPEAVFLEPRESGVVAHRCESGIDYQYWEGGKLLASRWSLQSLAPEDLQFFARDCGQALDALEPANDEAVHAPAPWSEPAFSWRTLLNDERLVMTGITTVLLFAICLELGLLAASGIRTWISESNTASLQEELGSRLQYRLQAERLHARGEQLASLLPAYTQVELIAEFTRLLAGQEYELREWDYTSGGVRVLVSNPELDGREIIRKLESSDLFTSARILPAAGEGEFSFELVVKGAES